MNCRRLFRMVSRPCQSATPRLHTASSAKQSKPLPNVLSSISFQKSSSHCGGSFRVKFIEVIFSLLYFSWAGPCASGVLDAGQGSTIGDYRRALNYAAGNNVQRIHPFPGRYRYYSPRLPRGSTMLLLAMAFFAPTLAGPADFEARRGGGGRPPGGPQGGAPVGEHN